MIYWMESSTDLIDRARNSLKVAEQMLIHTYPVVNDPKLILAVAGDIYSALTSSIEAVLAKENRKADDFHGNFKAFKEIAPKHSFKQDDIELINTIHNIITEHKESPVEFARKDKFVICDEKYNLDVLSHEDMKKYLFRARLFIEAVESIVREKQKDE
jgi:hypothetical protein